MTGKTYRSIRKRLGLTQAQLAERLGVTRTAVAYRERGLRPVTREAALAIRRVQQDIVDSGQEGRAMVVVTLWPEEVRSIDPDYTDSDRWHRGERVEILDEAGRPDGRRGTYLRAQTEQPYGVRCVIALDQQAPGDAEQEREQEQAGALNRVSQWLDDGDSCPICGQGTILAVDCPAETTRYPGASAYCNTCGATYLSED